VAQALFAARLTVQHGRLPHSLHAYFIRRGDPEEPVRFEVERLRDGRFFAARQVEARQSAGAILNISASFQAESPPTMDVQLARMPEVRSPDDGREVSWGPLFEMRLAGGLGRVLGDEHHDMRGLPPERESAKAGQPSLAGQEHEPGEAELVYRWFRVVEQVGTDPVMHAAALAYASDSGPAWLVEALHEARCSPGRPWRPVTLDHAIWFHRPFDASEWLLFEASVNSLHGSRGLTSGRVFSRDGRLVASVTQEVFLRRPRPAPGVPPAG
jgi:acyl-CoA thioesterase-2